MAVTKPAATAVPIADNRLNLNAMVPIGETAEKITNNHIGWIARRVGDTKGGCGRNQFTAIPAIVNPGQISFQG